jgi:hypothetical protein
MKIKISLDLITNVIEIIGAGFIVAGIGVMFGAGPCLLATGIGIITLSYFASLGSVVNK